MKTKIELQQAINNLTRMNGHGSYTKRIAEYQNQLDNYPETTTTRSTVTYTPEELKLIPFWLKDNINEITE